MAKEVKVPVRVEGSEKAQGELKKTGQAVKGVGAAGAQAAKGTAQATVATKAHTAAHGKAKPAIKGTAKAVNQFDDSAKTALTGILGQFNPMLASLGNIAVDVAKGVTKISRALIGMLGIGAAVAGGVILFQKFREGIRRTIEDADRLEKRIQKLRDSFKEPQERMAATLQRFNALTKETEEASGTYRRRLERRRGFARETAVAIAPLAVLDQLTLQEAELAAQLAVQGVSFEKPGDIRKTLDELRKRHPQILADAQRQIELMQPTQTITKRRARAGGQPVGAVRYTPEEFAREELIGAAVIPEDMTLQDFRKRVNEARRLRGLLDHMRQTGKQWVARTKAHPETGTGWGWWKRYLPITQGGIERDLARLPATAWVPTVEKWERRGDEPLAEPSLPSGPVEVPESVRAAGVRGAQVPIAVNNITQNFTTVNQGTAYNLDKYGMPWTRAPLTPGIIERGAGMP